jgi:PAS domain S-box-containing protein
MIYLKRRAGRPDTRVTMTKQNYSNHQSPPLRAALIVAAYLGAFIVLDYFSHQFEGLHGIVAWYPPAGLTYALLLAFGVRFAPAVTIALFFSALFIYRMPQPPFLLFLWAFIISLLYSAAAAFLRKLIRFDWRLQKVRDVAWLIATSIFVSALLAVLSVSSSALSSEMPRGEVLRAIFHWWIGESVGVLTVTPFLLIHVIPGLKRFTEGQPLRLSAFRSFPRPTLSTIGQAASIALTLYWVIGARVLDEFRPMYLISLPLIWIALQQGFKRVSAAILAANSGVMLALWVFRFNLSRLSELELLMIVNCIVGLLMGAVVTERKRSEEALRSSEEKYRIITENMTETIWLMDMDLHTTYISPSLEHSRGFTLEELKNMPTERHMTPESFKTTAATLAEELTLEHVSQKDLTISRTLVLELYRKDGSTFWSEFTMSLLRNPDDAPTGLLGVGRDITERMRVESQREDALVELQMQKEELETSNNQLMSAEKALQSQVKELQRWHAVTVDREGRMLELKKEVNDLLIETGRPVKYAGE